jgi:hypothetical protein
MSMSNPRKQELIGLLVGIGGFGAVLYLANWLTNAHRKEFGDFMGLQGVDIKELLADLTPEKLSDFLDNAPPEVQALFIDQLNQAKATVDTSKVAKTATSLTDDIIGVLAKHDALWIEVKGSETQESSGKVDTIKLTKMMMNDGTYWTTKGITKPRGGKKFTPKSERGATSHRRSKRSITEDDLKIADLVAMRKLDQERGGSGHISFEKALLAHFNEKTKTGRSRRRQSDHLSIGQVKGVIQQWKKQRDLPVDTFGKFTTPGALSKHLKKFNKEATVASAKKS